MKPKNNVSRTDLRCTHNEQSEIVNKINEQRRKTETDAHNMHRTQQIENKKCNLETFFNRKH